MCRNAKTSAQWFCRQIILNKLTVAVLFSVPGKPKHKQDLCYKGRCRVPRSIQATTSFVTTEDHLQRNGHLCSSPNPRNPPTGELRLTQKYHYSPQSLSWPAAQCCVLYGPAQDESLARFFPKRKNRGLGALVRRLVLPDETGSNLGIPIFNCQGRGAFMPSYYLFGRFFDFYKKIP